MSSSQQPIRKSRKVKSWMYISVLLVNVLVFACIAGVYNSDTHSYSEKLFDENINGVENLNSASANSAYTYISNMAVKVNDIVNYIEINNLSLEEAIKYLGESNTNPDRQLQLVLSGSYGDTGELSYGDYSGISFTRAKLTGGYYVTSEKEIVYGGGYYDMWRAFTNIYDDASHGGCFTAEFTDPDTKLKCFAAYRHISLTDQSGQERLYTILLAVNSQTALNDYNMQGEYDGQSSVLVNEQGEYIIKNSDYRNANFFDYIVNYNGLTLDWRAELQKEVKYATEDGKASANLFYKNHQGEDCIFSLAVMDNGWYSITCVPLASFNLESHTVNYSLIILLLFLALFLVDGAAIYWVGKLMSYNVTMAEQARQEADMANEAKSRFLSTMSHELRTPLNAIIGFASLSLGSIEDPPVLRDYLKKIDISSKLLLQLISDILDVSAIESNKMKVNKSEFDLTKLITSLSAIYYDQCSAKGIEFNVIVRNIHSEMLVGDSVRVNQVLLNFLSNAVKFTPSGGTIMLVAEQIDREEKSAQIRFTVSDTGCGISDEMKERLFKPFERDGGDASCKYTGTGLGLSIAKNLAELMSGSVGVQSRLGQGSVFWVELPFDIPAKATKRSFSPICNLHVLAAVSNEDERKYIGQMLTSFGVEHTLTDNAESAIEIMKENENTKKKTDLCILDWKLPDLDALDTAKKIRQQFDKEELKIMVLAYDIADAKPKCIAAGANLAFGKPVFASALYNALEEMATGQSRTVPDLTKSYDLKGKRVLLVEDNLMNIEIAELLLEKVGMEVEVAENGKIGLEKFTASEHGYFDAVLMDVQMPVMDGYEATIAIRESRHPQAQSIPILAMTADAFSQNVEKAHSVGMNDHLAKPIVPDNLYSALKKHL